MRRNFNIILFAILSSLIFFSCTFNDPNNVVNPPVTTLPTNPVPVNGAVNQENIIKLSWQYAGADSFTVYFDTQNPPQKIIKKNLTQNSITTFAAGNSTTYYWKISAKYKSGASVEGPVWKFTTKSGSTSSAGYVINSYGITTYAPNIIRALFQVTDLNNKGISNLTTSDFEVYEDGKKISSTESLLNITKKESNYFAFNTVLMIDNSTSITDDNGSNLATIKSAAKSFVANMFSQQRIAIYEFSGTINLVLDFTPATESAKINSAIDGIKKGARSTDLYGAVIQGASRIKQSMNADSIISGALVLFTDGDDTQGSHTLDQALNSITNKNVYTIGLGTDLNPEIMSLLGHNGFYPIADINQLTTTFLSIQQELSNLSNSFYWLEYQTPKRGNFNHLLQVIIVNNPINSILEGTFNSSKFTDPNPGIYFTSSSGDLIGNDTLQLAVGGESYEIFISTYGGSSNASYELTSDTLISVQKLNSTNSHIKVSANPNAANKSSSRLIVKDIINNYSGEINFIIIKSLRKYHARK
jgi:hypothetical protein